MSNLNFLLMLNTYSDSFPSNSPDMNNFRWTRALNSFPVMNPQSQALTIAPGQSITLINGMRTLNSDNTTQYSITPVGFSTTQYTLSAVGGTLPNFRTPRATGADATTVLDVSVNGPVVTFSGASQGIVAASFTGTLTGMTTPVTITADALGTGGNSIDIIPDGTSTVSQLISTWNTNNPSNKATLTSGDGTQIPTAGSFQLAGGLNSTALNLSSVVPGDNVIIGSNFNPSNQGQFVILTNTSTSFTVANPVGISEGPISLGSGFATQLQIFSAAGVQVGDMVKISSGFSPVTLGSYEITQVAANSLTFSSANTLPTEGPITAGLGVQIYFDAKQLVYVECDQPCILTINGVATDAIEPFVSGSSICPGVFLRKSTIYSLSVFNPGINPANLFFASCE